MANLERRLTALEQRERHLAVPAGFDGIVFIEKAATAEETEERIGEACAAEGIDPARAIVVVGVHP